MNNGASPTNIRAMSEDERRQGMYILQDFHHKTGDFITKSMLWNLNVRDRQLFERMKAAWIEYDQWLRK